MSALKRFILLFALSGCCRVVFSQDSSRHSYFKASASYLTNAVYNGRKDSLALPYFTPSLSYHHASGLYIKGSLSYLSSASRQQVDLVAVDAGYAFNIVKRLGADIYASKYFYSQSSTAARSEMEGGLGASITYDPGIVTISGSADLFFSQQTDPFASLGLSHNFGIGNDDDSWTIEPGILANFGTQNYYHDYLQNRPNKRKRSETTTTVTTRDHNSFTVLDYELAVPVYYDGKKWGLAFTPTYAIPQSPSTVSVTGPLGNTKTVTEKLENTFYAELSIYVKF